MAQTGNHTAHTPGPWEIGRVNSGPVAGAIPITTQGYRETFRDGVLITSVYGSAARSEANAHLIAAAPDMYEALKLVMQHGRIDDSEHRMNLVAAAIAKAEGR